MRRSHLCFLKFSKALNLVLGEAIVDWIRCFRLEQSSFFWLTYFWGEGVGAVGWKDLLMQAGLFKAQFVELTLPQLPSCYIRSCFLNYILFFLFLWLHCPLCHGSPCAFFLYFDRSGRSDKHINKHLEVQIGPLLVWCRVESLSIDTTGVTLIPWRKMRFKQEKNCSIQRINYLHGKNVIFWSKRHQRLHPSL